MKTAKWLLGSLPALVLIWLHFLTADAVHGERARGLGLWDCAGDVDA